MTVMTLMRRRRITSPPFVFGKFILKIKIGMKIIFFSHCMYLFIHSTSLADAMQQKLRLDSLQAISTEETVHDRLDSKSSELQTVPETLDVIVHPASIAYHACLNQLARSLVLPILVCPAKDPLTFLECRAPGPFQIQTKSRGTAVIMQWVCSFILCCDFVIVMVRIQNLFLKACFSSSVGTITACGSGTPSLLSKTGLRPATSFWRLT